MAQNFSPRCSQCGTPITPGMRFCSNCGATNDPEVVKPTAAASSGEYYRQAPEGPTEFSAPPPPASLYSQPAPNTYYPPQAYPQAQQGYQSNVAPQAQQGYQPNVAPVAATPAFAKPQKDSSKQVLGQIGCGVGILILLLLLVLGTAGYFGYKWISSQISSTSSTVTTGVGSNTGTGTGSGATSSVPLATTQINQTITYASVDLTILNVQEANSFTDDANSSTSVLVRLNLKEQNPTADTVYLSYSDNFRLILPDGTSVTPGTEQVFGSIAQAVNRTNWVDFPVPAKVDISTLTLRLGAATETQMDVPLTGKADLSKYQPKTISPNSTFQYAGLNWTITAVNSSLSADGKQAAMGMRYIVISMKVDNPTQNAFYPSFSDNARLQTGSTITPPTSTTFSSSFAAQTTGATGAITFQMPQNSSSLTLVFLARSDTTPPAVQVTSNFQI